MDLARKTAQGVLWNYVAFAGGKLLTFISTIILARLLAPDFFGQMAIALLVIGYLDAIGDLGVAAALIYQRDDVERASHVAFIISVAMGALLSVISFVSAPLIASYFNEPAVEPMLQVLAFTFLLRSFGNVHEALLSKELLFRRKLLPELIRASAKGFGAIALAILGFGAWSLVWGQILGAVTATIALWIIMPWRPRWLWDQQLGRTMLAYGWQMTLLSLIAIVWSTSDYMIIGKILGKTDLALYQQAFRITDLLIINFCFVAAKALFPSFAKLNHSTDALRQGHLMSMRYISFVTLPISIGLSAVAPLFVGVVYGTKWLDMTPALQLLALRAGIETLSFNSGDVLKASGRPGLINIQMLIKIIVMIPTLLVTVQYGFVAIAMAQIGITIVSMTIDLVTINRILGTSLLQMWNMIRPGLLASLGMGACVWMITSNTPVAWQWVGLIVSLVVGGGIYIGLLWLTERKLLLESIRSVRHSLRPSKQPAT